MTTLSYTPSGQTNNTKYYWQIITSDGKTEVSSPVRSYTIVSVGGKLQWDKTFGGRDCDGAYSVIQTSDGGYAPAGDTESKGAGAPDMWLVKVNASGTIQWDTTFGGRSGDRASSVIQTSDGGYAVTGWTRSKGAGGADMWLVKVNASGTIQMGQDLRGA